MSEAIKEKPVSEKVVDQKPKGLMSRGSSDV
jgi:hypothetical protein